MQTVFETPDQPDVRALIAELDAYVYPIYPAKSVYALDIASLCAPSVSFTVLRDAAGVAVGCGAMVMQPGYGEVKRVYVSPQVRGQGLARCLIEALETNAVENGCGTFMLETGLRRQKSWCCMSDSVIAAVDHSAIIPMPPFWCSCKRMSPTTARPE